MRVAALVGALVAGAMLAASSPASEAQPAMPRIGFLAAPGLSDPRASRYVQAFRQGLREHGYAEDLNIAVEYRWAEGQYDRLPALAAELVRLKVSVMVAAGPPAIQAAKQATATIPIVMAAVADPIAAGFVGSLARPGGNVTGLSMMHSELVGKQLEILVQVLPKVTRVACLGNPTNPNFAPGLRQAQDVARTLRVQLQPREVRASGDVDTALGAIVAGRAGAVIVLTDTVLLDERARIASETIRRRLPTMFGVSEFTEAGGLLAYGPSLADDVRRSAGYVGRILKGAPPGDLPVEQPTKFELVVNLKTAKALGLKIPQSVLQRADRVIQ